jgi:hypothetical protein
MRHPAALAAVLMLVLGVAAGCTDSEPDARPTATVTTTALAPSLGPLGRPGCDPESPRSSGSSGTSGFGEIQGTPGEAGTSLYGLLMLRQGETLETGVDIKIVWRMTGSRDGVLAVRLIDPDGDRKALTWGPELHGGSTYHRPGDEWGTGIRFDKTGCWEIRMSTNAGHASAWIDVTKGPA